MSSLFRPLNQEDNYRAFVEKYTPKRKRSSQLTVSNRMDGQLARISQRIQKNCLPINLKTAQKSSKSRHCLENQSINKFNKDKQNIIIHQDGPLRKSISKDSECVPLSFGDIIAKDIRSQWKQRSTFKCRSNESVKFSTSFDVLLRQNQKLAVKVGSLETTCSSISMASRVAKQKHENEVNKLQQKCLNECKQKIYLEKLCHYYKAKAIEYTLLLRQNGVSVNNEISETSMPEQLPCRK